MVSFSITERESENCRQKRSTSREFHLKICAEWSDKRYLENATWVYLYFLDDQAALFESTLSSAKPTVLCLICPRPHLESRQLCVPAYSASPYQLTLQIKWGHCPSTSGT